MFVRNHSHWDDEMHLYRVYVSSEDSLDTVTVGILWADNDTDAILAFPDVTSDGIGSAYDLQEPFLTCANISEGAADVAAMAADALRDIPALALLSDATIARMAEAVASEIA